MMNPNDKYSEEEALRIYERLQGRDLGEELLRREAELSGEISDLVRKASDVDMPKAVKWYNKAAEAGDKVMPDSWGQNLTLNKGPSPILPHGHKTMFERGKSEGMKVGNAKPSVGYANVRELTRTQTAVKPRLAVKVAKPAVVRAVKTKPRPNILLTVLQTARTKLAHITARQIKADPMTVLRQIALVKKAVIDELGGPTIEDRMEAAGRPYSVYKRLDPDQPPPDPVEENLQELKSSATDAMRSLRDVADGEGDAKFAHAEVRRFNKAVTLTLALVAPRADGSVLTTPIGYLSLKDRDKVVSGARRLPGVSATVPMQEDAPDEMSEPQERRRRTRLVRPGSRAADYADICKYIIACLEDWRKSLKKAYRTELEHGVTKNLSLPSVQYIADWIVQEKKKAVTRRKVEWALFCALGTSVDNYKQKHNAGRQAFEERQQLIDSKPNAKKTDLSLTVKDYRFSKDLDKLNPTIIRYWENMTTNCAFVLLPRKKDASAVKFDRERYIRALRLALQAD